MHAEAAVFPAQELAGQLRGEQFLLDEHLDDPHTEKLLQGRGAHPRRDVEHAVVREEPVGHEGVDVAIVAHVLAKGVDRHDHAKLTCGPVEAAAQEFEQALVGDPAKLLQELAVVAEPTEGRRPAQTCRSERSERQLDPQHDGQAEDILTVRNRVGDCAGNERTEEQNLLLVA